MVGRFSPSLAGSELAKQRGELEPGLPPVDIEDARAAIAAVREAVREGALRVAHDISDGGLACALAECAIAGGVGVEVDLGELIAERGGDCRRLAVRRGQRRLRRRRRGRRALASADRRGRAGRVIGRAGGSGLTIAAGEAADRHHRRRRGGGLALARRAAS